MFAMTMNLLNKIFLIFSHVKWGWDFLLHHSLFPIPSSSSSSSSSLCNPAVLRMIDSHSVRQTVCTSDQSHECAVCLCRIDIGDEIRRLKCSHVFHRVCFDRWVGYGQWTCPLCRNHLRGLDFGDGGDHAKTHLEILVYGFSEVGSSGNKDLWWLR